jgi:glycosyltransferase involved in cell wall biosynthesis
MPRPFFSIITCARNSQRFLAENIASVRAQTCRDFEHIFVDGSSTDGTLPLIKRYRQEAANQDFPVRLILAEPRGIAAAMNQGWRQAQGEYLIYLHSDDALYDEWTLEKVAAFLKDRRYDWIYGQIAVRDEERAIGLFPTRKLWQADDGTRLKSYLLKLFNYVPHQAVFIKREILAGAGGFDETLSSAMDPDLWLRLRTRTRWTFVPEIISRYRVHAGAQSSSRARAAENKKNQLTVWKRYLNPVELILAGLIAMIADRKSRLLR